MHNLHTVFSFELRRTLKKKSFWIAALAFPLVIFAIFGVVFLSSQASQQAAIDLKEQSFSFGVTDPGHLLSDALLAQSSARRIADKQQGIDLVKSSRLDAYFYYPATVNTHSVEVYAKDVGLFNNSRYQAAAETLLQQAAASKSDPQTVAILRNTVSYATTTYQGNQPVDGFKQVIVPGIFLVLFYILIAMFGNQMLTTTTEEKENRVIEMLLTTVSARTIIIGKILAMISLAFIQIIIILTPILIGYLIGSKYVTIPHFDFSGIPFDPTRIAIGAVTFIFSFLLFTGLLVAIGSAVPTAKEANGFFAIVMMFLFGPLYAVSLFVSSPHAPIVSFMSLFPLTAPIPLMLRNAVGNLPLSEALIGMTILAVSACIALALAIRIFRYGALEYNDRLSLSKIFTGSKKGA
jgi:ABC-2 type transport system permease protein